LSAPEHPAGGSRVGADIARLLRTIGRTILPAIVLAGLSAALLFPIGTSTAAISGSIAGWLIVALFLWFHGIFIAALVWQRIKSATPLAKLLLHPGMAAGAILALLLAPFAWLDSAGASTPCADGLPGARSGVPNLPWLWIGWLLLALTAAPARALGLVAGEQPRLIPVPRRLLLAVLVSPVILISGFVFQWRTPDCARPVECCGLFEGGLVVLPLLGLFLFLASYTLAALCAASVAPDIANPHGAGAGPPR
jgi:hypothetical protein